MKLYLRTKTGADATGEYNPASKELTVKKGSLVSADVHTDGKFRSANSVLKYREQYCDGNHGQKRCGLQKRIDSSQLRYWPKYERTHNLEKQRWKNAEIPIDGIMVRWR